MQCHSASSTEAFPRVTCAIANTFTAPAGVGVASSAFPTRCWPIGAAPILADSVLGSLLAEPRRQHTQLRLRVSGAAGHAAGRPPEHEQHSPDHRSAGGPAAPRASLAWLPAVVPRLLGRAWRGYRPSYCVCDANGEVQGTAYTLMDCDRAPPPSLGNYLGSPVNAVVTG